VEAEFQLQRLGRKQAGRLDRVGVFVPKASKPGRGD
jgi:hypothetical protein